jgi:amino acid transporter
MKTKILIGLLLSLLVTLLGSYLYMEYVMEEGFEASWKWMIETRNIDEILPLGAIPNLLLFFVFNKRKEYYKARGVIMGVIIIALIVFWFFIKHLL